MKTYPVIIFCYNRLDHLRLTVEHLKKSLLASETELYIYSDAAKTPSDEDKIKEVRAFLHSLNGFKSVTVTEAKVNKGLANAIIDGVSEVLKTHEAAIVLEDDLISSDNFLSYMNSSLEFYKNNPKVFSVSGYSFPINVRDNYPFDNYFTRRGSSWGWGTWRNRWDNIDWEVTDYKTFSRDRAAQREFNRMGSDLSGMLARQMEGKISSWAIRWCYHQFKTNTYTAFPLRSKVENIGFGAAATHTSSVMRSRFATDLDNSGRTSFLFDPQVTLNPAIIKQFTARYSIFTRLKYKAMGYFFK